ncbi:MAG: MBL fold metallo-hydrolase [Chitinophagaceae bacterium]|nr:MBL fold metallo-hydrolase [Chitinophagaceae bacterium]
MALFKTFGSNPSGKDLAEIVASVNYKNKVFHNNTETITLREGVSYIKLTWRFLNKPKYTAPSFPLPSIRTDLKSVAKDKPVIIWFGHSSYLIFINGKTILVDPVLSGYASPFSFTGKSFRGSDVYDTGDLPEIDLLILTHDHYDHLDYQTVLKLKNRTKAICTSLGVGSHLQYWGFDKTMITGFDWWDSRHVFEDTILTAAPARHFSGRSFTRNKTLWSSFILQSGGYRIYIGSDSGYGSHFTDIGNKYGPFDIALLEAGQYNTDWPDIHMMPEQTVQASLDLKAKVLMPVHWGKFALALHPWDEPVKRVLAKAKELNVAVATPMIGEQVIISGNYPSSAWWENISS